MAIAASGTLLGGRYLLDRPIAEGGMGAVWRARHLKLDIPVAVKVMSPALAASASARARFEREAKAAARLTSPHVVEVHDYGVEGDAPYIVMEHLNGEDLSARLAARGRLGVEETAEIVDQIAKALEVAHAAGVVHRDLKPANVFLARAGREEIVKVLDFGVAKLRAEPGTLPGMLMGSPSYMSPEQARSEGALDHRSDLWSLGVVAFQCLTGQLPFDDDDVTALILAICSAKVPAASSFVPSLGPGIDRFFERALARAQGERYQAAPELSEALRELAGLGPRARVSLRPPPRAGAPPAAGRDSHARDDEATVATPLHEVIAGRFELRAPAGEGSMGVVFEARDRIAGGTVAVKLFRPAMLDTERFFREARALVEVRHPGVVRYVAHGLTAEGRPYLATEWIEGGDLAARLREGPLGVAESLALAVRVADALGRPTAPASCTAT